jgi:hypothetical protein
MEIPFHIQEIAKLYPVLSAPDNNLADGRIENWSEMISYRHELPRPGEYMELSISVYFDFKNHKYKEVWVYLGNYFFKQIYKKKVSV